jgi:hypothetical protein
MGQAFGRPMTGKLLLTSIEENLDVAADGYLQA